MFGFILVIELIVATCIFLSWKTYKPLPGEENDLSVNGSLNDLGGMQDNTDEDATLINN